MNQLKPGTWLINASRGPVIDNAALRQVLLQREDLQAVLDVWEAEPEVDVALVELCVLATPHIAGYSLDGKQRGTAQIYQAFLRVPRATGTGSPERLAASALVVGSDVERRQ